MNTTQTPTEATAPAGTKLLDGLGQTVTVRGWRGDSVAVAYAAGGTAYAPGHHYTIAPVEDDATAAATDRAVAAARSIAGGIAATQQVPIDRATRAATSIASAVPQIATDTIDCERAGKHLPGRTRHVAADCTMLTEYAADMLRSYSRDIGVEHGPAHRELIRRLRHRGYLTYSETTGRHSITPDGVRALEGYEAGRRAVADGQAR